MQYLLLDLEQVYCMYLSQASFIFNCFILSDSLNLMMPLNEKYSLEEED